LSLEGFQGCARVGPESFFLVFCEAHRLPLGKIDREEWLSESRFDGKAIIFRGSSSDDANARDFPRVVISDKALRERPPVKVESQLRSGEGETVSEW